MLPYWYDVIVPDLRAGKITIVSAHGNSLRALVKHLKGISDDDIPSLEIPTGVPWVFTLDADLRPTTDGYLGQA
jgi:2,3-bisphosphoglycerate-dependent phosphoglycerate mutase